MKLDQEALAHLNDLYSFALRLTRDPVCAEDLVQDALVRVLAQVGEGPLRLRPYLFRTLRNLHIDQWRRQQREGGEQSWNDDAGCALSDAPEQILLQEMLSDWLEGALDKLELPLRECLWLREVDGFSYAEISEITDTPLGTVRSRLARARTQMLALIDGPGRAHGQVLKSGGSM